MKRKWNHPEPDPLDPRVNGVESWTSPGQLNDSPEFREWVDREFPQGLAELKDDEDQNLSRRSFLRFMGASTALAGFGLAACRRPVSYLIPFTDNVEWAVPGKPLYYASTMPRGDWSWPTLVTTIDGRPTMLGGNKLHPDGVSGLDHFGVAEIIELYDPDRSTTVLEKSQQGVSKDSSIERFNRWFSTFSDKVGKGEKVAFLLGDGSSPTENRLLNQIAGLLPAASFYRYEAVNKAASRAAAAQVYGQGARVLPRLKDANRVLSLDSDFLHIEAISPNSAHDFHAAHRPEDDDGTQRSADKMSRLYMVESAFSLTGGMADHRLRMSYAGTLRFALALARQLAEDLDDSALGAAVANLDVDTNFVAELKPFQRTWLEELSRDLAFNKGSAVVLPGDKHGTALHLLALAMNTALEAPQDVVRRDDLAVGSLEDLYQAVGAGELTTLFSLTPADPVYDAPRGEKEFAATLEEKSVTLIHLGLHTNATARFANWHVPAAHWLEGWNDGISAYGQYSVVQPMIEPLYQGEPIVNFLLRFLPESAQRPDGLAADDDPARVAVAETFSSVLGETPEVDGSVDNPVLAAWEACLRSGFHQGESALLDSPKVVGGGALAQGLATAWQADIRPLPTTVADSDNGAGLEIVFAADPSLLDGRYANNGWLQEAPDPVTKLTWDNAALISAETAIELGPKIGMPHLAKELGAERAVEKVQGGGFQPTEDDDHSHVWKSKDRKPPMVAITVNGVRINMPLLLAFGHSNDTITVHLGYGRKKVGRVGDGLDDEGVGFDVNPLRISRTPHVGTIQKIEAPGAGEDEFYEFALTAEHHTMFGRGLVAEAPLETEDSEHGNGYNDQAYSPRTWIDAHAPDNPPIYRAEDWKGEPMINDKLHQWGMVIDLTTCTGCNACLVACQAENNIPIVGKKQVKLGREMHWIRMDRYFSNRTAPRASHSHGEEMESHNPDPGNPEMLVQPVACQQCEYAPCETVCPVNATVHSADGLNLMAYNRCIGTRYCANNCPYKARRFNFFDYNKRPIDKLYQGPLADPDGLATTSLKLQKNPNVTVRMRGVMEKCTYCIQRIQEAKIDAKSILPRKTTETGKPSELVTISNDELRIPSNAVSVACQDACPGDSIVFGNLLDPNDKIRRYKELDLNTQTHDVKHNHKRGYDLLAYIGTRPRTSYLGRVRNLNPRLPESRYRGDASVSIH